MNAEHVCHLHAHSSVEEGVCCVCDAEEPCEMARADATTDERQARGADADRMTVATGLPLPATTDQDAAEGCKAYLRPLLPSGATLYATAETSRSGASTRLWLYVGGVGAVTAVTYDVAEALRMRYRQDKGALIAYDGWGVAEIAERLSLALHGRPGQITGEYL